MKEHEVGQAETLIDAEEVARRFGCTARHIRKLADEGKLPPLIRISRLVRWRESEIDSFIRGGCDIEKWKDERGIRTPRIAEAG